VLDWLTLADNYYTVTQNHILLVFQKRYRSFSHEYDHKSVSSLLQNYIKI